MASVGQKIRSDLPTSGDEESAWSRIWRIVRVGIGVAIVVLLWRQVTGASDVHWESGSLRAWPTILCVGLMLPNLLLEITAWRMLLRGAGLSLSIREAVPAVLAGFTAGAISPGGVGDFVGRVIRIRPSDRWLTGVAMGLSRIADGIAICVVGLPAAIVLTADSTGAVAAWTKTVIGFAIPVLVLLLAVYLGRDYAVPRRWLGSRLKGLREAVNLAAQIPGSVRFQVMGLALTRCAVFVTQLCVAVIAIGGASSLTVPLALAASTVFLLRSIAPPVTFMGLGIREAAAVAVFPLVGVPGQEALLASLLVFGSNLLLPALVGVPFLLFPEWRANHQARGAV